MANKIIHKHSSVVTDGNVKLPTSSQLEYGELAVNYSKDNETISLKNSENEIVEFKSKDYFDEKINNINTILDSKSDEIHKHTASDITGGTLALARIPTGTSSSTVALGDHIHDDYTTNATFTKYTGATNTTFQLFSTNINNRALKSDLTTLSGTVGTLRNDFDTLVSGNTDTVIESFKEVTAFLSGVTDTQSLDGIIGGISSDIDTHKKVSGGTGTIEFGHVKLITGNVSGKTYTKGEAAAAAHSHDNYAPISHSHSMSVITSGTITLSGQVNGTVTYNGTNGISANTILKTAGSATQPVYITSGGVICACTAYSGASVSSATNATNVYVTSNSANTVHYLTFASGNTNGNKALRYDSNLSYNPSSHTLTTKTVQGVTVSGFAVYGSTIYKNEIELDDLYSPLEHSHSNYTTDAEFTGHTSTLGETGTTGHVKIITGDVSGKTYTKGEAAAAAHSHGNYAKTSHATSATTYGVGTTSNYGHVKISNGDVASVAHANGLVAGMDHSHSNYSTTDTKNTAGSTNSTSKLFLIGSTSQTGSSQTYSNSKCYTQSDYLYSNGEKVDMRLTTALVPIGTSIPSDTDLNTITYLKVGKYCCSVNDTVKTLVNCPTENAFTMEVYSLLSTTIDNESTTAWCYRLRRLTTYIGNEYIQFCRSDGSKVWTYNSWQLIPKSNVSGTTLSIGSATQPVYIDSMGILQSCTSYSSASVSSATNATNVYVTSNSANTVHYLTFASGNTNGNKALRYDSNLSYNPSSNTLTVYAGTINTSKISASTITASTSMYSAAFYETSDERLKNFQDKIPVDLDKLSKLKKNYFTWKEKERGEKLEIGVSAQEIKELYPEIVSDEGETLSVAYDKLSVVALSAVDILYEENKSLKNKISELEEQIKNINEFIKTLKK